MNEADRLCAQTADRQFGVISRVQAHAAGHTDEAISYRVALGRWQRVLPNVFRIGGAPDTRQQRLMAAVLWAGETAAVSHRAAARLHGWDGFQDDCIEIACPKKLRAPAPWLIAHRPGSLPPEEITSVAGIAVTNPARTLLDLGSVAGIERVERALDHALRVGEISFSELRAILRRHGAMGRDGTACLRALLAERDPDYVPPESTLERDFKKIFKNGGLPEPRRQHPVPHGRRVYRIDFAYPNEMLAIEIDSYKHHFGRRSWHSDRVRGNVLVAKGWSILHFAQEDKSRPDEVVAEVRAALERARALRNKSGA